MRANVKD